LALWTHAHYQAPAGPSWIGMMVRTGMFATWPQVAREWVDQHSAADRICDELRNHYHRCFLAQNVPIPTPDSNIF